MANSEQRMRVEVFYRLLATLREQNEAGEISGLMISVFNDTDNWCSSERSGNMSRQQRVRDVKQLITTVKRNPNFTKVFYRGTPRFVAGSEKRRTDRYIKQIERERTRTPIEGTSLLVYKTDGTTLAHSFSNASRSAHLTALRDLEDLAQGEFTPDGGEVVTSGGPLDYQRYLTPSPEAEALAHELGDKLPVRVCSCGAPMRLTSGRPRPQDPMQHVTFGCTRCAYFSWVSLPSGTT